MGQIEAPEYLDETIEITQDYFERLITREYKNSFMFDITRREQMNIYIDHKLAEYRAVGKFELMNTFASLPKAPGREIDNNIP